LEKLNFNAVEILPAQFVPVDIPGMSINPKFKNETCNGILIKVKDYDNFNPVQFGIALVSILKKLYPDEFKINSKRMNLLIGDDKITELLNSGTDFQTIVNLYQEELNKFKQIRNKYLLYN
jgi:uncharacterized protein YbbC (DUF1343 family)